MIYKKKSLKIEIFKRFIYCKKKLHFFYLRNRNTNPTPILLAHAYVNIIRLKHLSNNNGLVLLQKCVPMANLVEESI